MPGTSFNLVDLIREHLTGDVVNRMSTALGEGSDRTRTAVTGAVPALLSALDRAASTRDGAQRITSTVNDTDDSMLNNVTGMFGKGFSSDSGSGILRSILGVGGLSDLSNSVGRLSGLSGRNAASIIGM